MKNALVSLGFLPHFMGTRANKSQLRMHRLLNSKKFSEFDKDQRMNRETKERAACPEAVTSLSFGGCRRATDSGDILGIVLSMSCTCT